MFLELEELAELLRGSAGIFGFFLYVTFPANTILLLLTDSSCTVAILSVWREWSSLRLLVFPRSMTILLSGLRLGMLLG